MSQGPVDALTLDQARAEVEMLRSENKAMRAAIKAALDARDAFRPGEAQLICDFDAALKADRIATAALRAFVEAKP